MWAKSSLLLALTICSQRVFAHALGTDPTLIERLEAGATLPTELASTWSLWFVFALLASQNLPRVGSLFAGLGVGALMGVLTWSLVTVSPAILLALLLVAALWMTLGRATPGLVAVALMALVTLMAINVLLHAHADLADDHLIGLMAALFTVIGASFCGGLVKQVASWFPKPAPIGLRILSSWMVALLAIQVAAGSLT